MLKIYTKSKGCVQCDTVKRWIERNGHQDKVEYLYTDLDERVADEARSYGFTQAPVLVSADGEVTGGFNPDFLARKVA